MNIDKTENYAVWDDTEAVQVSLVRNAGTVTVDVPVALRGPLNKRDVDVLGAMGDTADTAWNIPRSLLDPDGVGRKLQRNDTILDPDGQRWAVVYADHIEDRTCWRALCAPQRD